MIGVGERIPSVEVWPEPSTDSIRTDALADGRVLLLFYLYDWSTT